MTIKRNPVTSDSLEHWPLVKMHFGVLVKQLMEYLEVNEEQVRSMFRSVKPQARQNNCWLNVCHSPNADQVNEIEVVYYKSPNKVEMRLKYIQKLSGPKKQEVVTRKIMEFNDFSEMIASVDFKNWFGFQPKNSSLGVASQMVI